MKKTIILFGTFLFLFTGVNAAMPELSGAASVNITSDTSSNAKTMALGQARRQIITDALSPYVNKKQFDGVLAGTSDSVLSNLIAVSGIDSERLSSTTYSANIKMTLDGAATDKWLTDNNVQNWLNPISSGANSNMAVIRVDLPGGLRDWILFSQVARDNKYDFNMKKISDAAVTIEIPLNSRGAFLSGMGSSGWKNADMGEYTRLWK